RKDGVTSNTSNVPLPPGFDDLIASMDDLDENPQDASMAIEVDTKARRMAEFEKINEKRFMAKMPTFNIQALYSGNKGELMPRIDIGEPTMAHLRKIQLMGEFGLLVARGFHDLSGNRMNPAIGVHAQ